MNEITFSVCITTHNMSRYLETCIKSVLGQKTDFKFDILICNDFSTDNSDQILAKYESFPGIKVINNSENIGVLRSLQQLLKIATGKYIALLDGDDYWISEKHLQSHYEVYNTEQNTGFIFGNYILVEESTGKATIGMPSNFHFPVKKQFEFSIINYPILTSTSSFRRALVTKEEIAEYVLHEFPTSDYGIFLGLMLKTEGFYLSGATTNYNFRANSQSRKSNTYNRINHIIKRHAIGDYFIKIHPIDKKLLDYRDFLFKQKVLFASWLTFNSRFVKDKARQLSLAQFLKYNPKASYIYIASKNKLLYKLLRPWVLRKRPPGK